MVAAVGVREAPRVVVVAADEQRGEVVSRGRRAERAVDDLQGASAGRRHRCRPTGSAGWPAGAPSAATRRGPCPRRRPARTRADPGPDRGSRSSPAHQARLLAARRVFDGGHGHRERREQAPLHLGGTSISRAARRSVSMRSAISSASMRFSSAPPAWPATDDSKQLVCTE